MPRKRVEVVPSGGSESLSHTPFATLAGRIEVPAAPAPALIEAPDSKARPPAGALRLEGKLVVRRETKGRGGKSATRVSGLPTDALDDLAARMKKALGCGALVENGDLLLLGSVQDRAIEWLAREGPHPVIKGN